MPKGSSTKIKNELGIPDSNSIFYEILKNNRGSFSIDQALDGVGVGFVFIGDKNSNSTMALQQYLFDSLPSLDLRFKNREVDIKNSFKKALDSFKDTGEDQDFFIDKLETRNYKEKKKIYFGRLFSCSNLSEFSDSLENKNKFLIIIHFLIKNPPSDEPEWFQARRIAKNLSVAVAGYDFLLRRSSISDYFITIEGMALHGMPGTTSILPCLGIVYGSIWEELSKLDNSIFERVRELPIGSWKKKFSGKGNAKKSEISQLVDIIGFKDRASDDETDAIAMALVGATSESILKKTCGRIRPERKKKE